MNSYLLLVFVGFLGQTLAQGTWLDNGKYLRRSSKNVVESMKKAAEIEAMLKADETPMMEQARQIKKVNPTAAEYMVEAVGKSESVRQAAAEGAVKKAVEMGAVNKSQAPIVLKNLMDSPMIRTAATDGAAMIADEPIVTRNMDDVTSELTESIPKLEKTSRNSEDKANKQMKKLAENAVQLKTEEVLRDALEGEQLRSDKLKPLVKAIKDSDIIHRIGAEAAVTASRRRSMLWDDGMYRNDLEQMKHSELVHRAVQEGVLRAVQNLLRSEPSSMQTYRSDSADLSTLDELFKTKSYKRAAMRAAMNIVERLDLMRRASKSNTESAVEMVRMCASNPIVLMEAAKRAMEMAVDHGVIAKKSTNLNMLREVAKLPSIRSAAAMAAVKKAVDMGITA